MAQKRIPWEAIGAIAGVLALLVAIVVCLCGDAIVLRIGQPVPPPSPKPSPTSTPTISTVTPIPPTNTPAPPTDTPTSLPTTNTPTSEPTTPTPSTPTPPCPSGDKCYDDSFSELDPELWCEVPEEGFTVQEGQFVITANKDIPYEIHPCEHLSWDLSFVELELRIDETSGPSGNAHMGIGATLSGDRYLNFALDSAGNAFLEHGHSGNGLPPQTDAVVSLGSTDEPHILRIEWTGTEVHFFVDGSPLDSTLASSGYGNWFFIYARAYPGASIVARFDGVKWGVSP